VVARADNSKYMYVGSSQVRKYNCRKCARQTSFSCLYVVNVNTCLVSSVGESEGESYNSVVKWLVFVFREIFLLLC
jgi:hypothetical protein